MYAFLLLVQDCLYVGGCDLLRALGDAGVIDLLVATLKHESPFCVAAAAGALAWLGQAQGGGQGLVEESGAVPALVDVIRRSLPARNLEGELAVFQRSVPVFC
jgi:hypothetical protein